MNNNRKRGDQISGAAATEAGAGIDARLSAEGLPPLDSLDDATTTSGRATAEHWVRADEGVASALIRATGGRWAEERRMLRELGDQAPASPRGELSMEEYRDWVDDAVAWVAATGIPASGFPVEMGGTGDVGGTATAFEMLGYGDLSLMVKTGVQWGLFGGAVAELGTERHRHLVPAIIDGNLMGCFAMTETGHGSDVQSLETMATYDAASDELIVHSPSPSARKDYIGGAARSARMAAVFARLIIPGHEEPDQGVHCVLVPLRDEAGAPLPGVTPSDCGVKGGLLGVDNGRLMFDQVRVPRVNLLGRYGDIDDEGRYHSRIESRSRRFFTMVGTLVRGRICVAGGAQAATRSALAIAVTYGERRTQFRAPGTGTEVSLLDYRVHQRKLIPPLATAYALAFAQNDLVGRLHDLKSRSGDEAVGDQDGDAAQRELEALAAGLKAYSTRWATDTIQVCREACGGAGYLGANRLVRLRADTDVFATFEGDNTVLMQLVAKSLLTNFQRAFGSMDVLDMARFGSRTVAEAVVERTSVRSLVQRFRDTWQGERLADPAEQLRLLTERETHLLAGLARRMRRSERPDQDAFAVANNAQDHLLATAEAHVERNILEAFLDGVAATQDPEARALLEKLCGLYALSTVEKHKAWYLEHDRLSPDRAKAVTAAVNTLCAELRPHAGTLVAGFGIPAAWLRTEMLG